MTHAYPFTALVGQDAMKLALVLNAVNPRLGGVLVRGEKGTAKSTAARGLAALLPPIQVVADCRFGCDPAPQAPHCPECAARGELSATERQPAFVDLPIGATEDRVLGTLDLEAAIQRGERHFEPGLLARAHRGLLYVDEVNLLPDHLVDGLLDAAAMGTNTVEREGVSFSHPAAFVLVGTMNPEEGDLRPQLLDRFALAVDVAGMAEPGQRAEVVRRRVGFEADPAGFVERWRPAENAERTRIAAARACLARVEVPDDLLELIARVCIEFQVDGLRADVVIYKTAATLAAYFGRRVATVEDVRQAAELALPHRRRRQPFDQPGLDHERLQQLIDEHRAEQAPAEQSRVEESRVEESRVDESGVEESRVEEPRVDGPDEAEASDDGDQDAGPSDPGPGAPPDHGPNPAGGLAEQVFDIGPPAPIDAPSVARPAPPRAMGRPARRGLARAESSIGRHVRSVPLNASDRPRPLDLAATLRAAALAQPDADQGAAPTRSRAAIERHHERLQAPRRRTAFGDQGAAALAPGPPRLTPSANARRARSARENTPSGGAVVRIRREHVRLKVRTAARRTCTLFVVDASGSMAARRRMAAAKGAVLSLLLDVYQRRDTVGLIAFRGTAARLLLPPTNSAQLAHARLRDLPTGGRTPLAAALHLAHAVLRRQTSQPLAVLVSDGRANVALSGGEPHAEALAAARALGSLADVLVVDTEEGLVRLGLARALCEAAGGQYLNLGEPLAPAIRRLRRASAW